jgi:hypothetical protein
MVPCADEQTNIPAERLLMIESMNLAGRGGRYCDEVSAVRRRRAESGVPVLS